MKSQVDVFINRELSWIEFNKRVLLTGMEKEYKILDKVKFCSIFSNNLDEFFMVRVASLKAQVEAGITKKSIDGLTPKEQLTKINKEVKKLTTLQENYVNNELNDELKIIGKVINLENEKNNLIVIELFKNQKKVLVPFVKEIVPFIDIKNNFLIINPPNGLLEL